MKYIAIREPSKLKAKLVGMLLTWISFTTFCIFKSQKLIERSPEPVMSKSETEVWKSIKLSFLQCALKDLISNGHVSTPSKICHIWIAPSKVEVTNKLSLKGENKRYWKGNFGDLTKLPLYGSNTFSCMLRVNNAISSCDFNRTAINLLETAKL